MTIYLLEIQLISKNFIRINIIAKIKVLIGKVIQNMQ